MFPAFKPRFFSTLKKPFLMEPVDFFLGDAEEEDAGAACHGEHDSATDERGEATEQIMAENLIGLDEAHIDDPGARFAVLQRKLELLNSMWASLSLIPTKRSFTRVSQS